MNKETMPKRKQGFPFPLKTQQLSDGRYMMLLADFVYVDSRLISHIAPKGLNYDGGTIPRFFWRLIGSPFTGKARYAYPIHDWECKQAHKAPTRELRKDLRKKADATLREVCQFLDVPRWKAFVLYRGVRIGAIVAR